MLLPIEVTIPNNQFSKQFFRGWSGKVSFWTEKGQESYQCTCKSRYLLKNGNVRVKFEAKSLTST